MSQRYVTLEDEYRRNKELKKEDIVLLQNWMNKQEHLPKINELKLLAFLHACYYKIEPTKTCIENYYTIRAHWPEFIRNRDILSDELKPINRMMLGTMLPVPTKHNHMVMYTRLMNTDPNVFNHLSQMRIFDMLIAMWYRILGTSDGQVLLADMEGAVFGHLVKMNVTAAKKQMYYIQEAIPNRLKAIHLLNVSPLTDKFINLVKPFLQQKMIDMMHFHKNIDTVYEYIPKEALPNEYGGRAGTFKELHEKQIKLMEENAEYFLTDGKDVVDESKRVGKPKNLGDIFGIEGTFKKLDID